MTAEPLQIVESDARGGPLGDASRRDRVLCGDLHEDGAVDARDVPLRRVEADPQGDAGGDRLGIGVLCQARLVQEPQHPAMTRLGVFAVEGLLMHPLPPQEQRAVLELLTTGHGHG